MEKKIVYLMSGPSGAGKSTYVRGHMTPGCEWISRDKIRFSIVREDEEYFSHEDEVFDIFINYINQTLENPDIHTIYIDATHLNKASRNKTISRLNRKYIKELNCICFNVSLEVCKERNSLRSGREIVPSNVLERMYYSFSYPKKAENFDHLYIVNEKGDIWEAEYKNESNLHLL